MKHAATKSMIILTLLGAGGTIAAQNTAWVRSCRFVVEVDGRPDPNASLYERRGVADLVGHLPGGPWFLVRPTSQTVHILADGAMEQADGGTSFSLLAEPTDSGQALTLTPSGLTFDVAGRWLRVIPAPDLLGNTTPKEFLDLCPEFQAREEAYQPDRQALQQIASCGRDLTLEIYFGSWCPHCQQVLPKLFKCLRMADNDNLKVRMIGLPRGFGTERQVREREVRGVPTVIVLEAGQEVGRFSGSEKAAIETTLATMGGG